MQGTRFWKMTGAGNDFIVLQRSVQDLPGEAAAFVRNVCRRGTSVGADGVLFVTTAGSGTAASAGRPGAAGVPAPTGMAGATVRAGPPAVELVHYNADGGRSAFCGNGTRCAARFAVLRGLATSPMLLKTDVGPLRADVRGDRVRIEAPAPSEPLPVRCSALGAVHEGWLVQAGVPHFVVRADTPRSFDLDEVGPVLRSHAALGPEGANVDILGPARMGRHEIRTFERGVEAETLACGSGALAAAAVLASLGENSPIALTTASGEDLIVEFEGDSSAPRGFHLSGEARVVFQGTLAEWTETAGEIDAADPSR